jgi:hypothetical protein
MMNKITLEHDIDSNSGSCSSSCKNENVRRQEKLSLIDEDDSEEIWNDVLPDDLQTDLSSKPPPVPVKGAN